MANEIITTLHPDQDPDTNLYPNIKKDNIPDGSVDENKIDPVYTNEINNHFLNIENDIDDVNTRIDDLSNGSPRYVNTSTNILALTSNQGLAVGTDTGHWYYWDGTQYVDGGVYQATQTTENLRCRVFPMLNLQSFTLNHYDVSGSIGIVNDPTNPLYNKWACADEFLCVGNTKKIIFQSNYPVTLDVVVYKYDNNRDPINFDEVYKLKNTEPLIIDKPSGTQYVRISINDTSGLDLNNYDIIVSLEEWGFYLNEDYTNDPVTPINASDFGVNVIVETTGRGDYTDISTAYNDNDRKPCIELKDGVYNVDGNGLSLGKAYFKGENRDLTIIKNGNAHYPYSAIDLVEGVIENITFYSTANDTSTPAYAMHLENNDTSGKKIKFYNCVFISDYNASVGIGLRSGLDIEFYNCKFITNNTNNTSGSAKGAVFFHDSIDSNYYGYQSIKFINCLFKSANNYALSMESVNSANTLIATFINCNFYTKERQNKNVIYFANGRELGYLCGNSIKLSNRSSGNNIDLLNYDKNKYIEVK